MNSNLLIGLLYTLIAQIATFIQLQGNVKYNFYEKHPIILLLTGIPISLLYIKSVQYLVTAYGGEIWPSRLIGFGVGIVVFSTLSYFLFNESFSLKTIVCLILGMSIILIQVFWKS